MSMTFRNIIAATDLSTCSGRAIAFADTIARSLQAGLTILHVASGRPAYATQYDDHLHLDDEVHVHEKPREVARRKLDQFLAAQLPEVQNANVVVAAGSVAPRILASAKTLDADLIVLATRGRDLMRRAFLGSVAEAVIRDSEIPVMSIRCGKRAPDLTFRRIVCAVNYTGVSGRAFAHSIALASAFGVRYR
jgi:nucleotide-binding universal stress UspA family protein